MSDDIKQWINEIKALKQQLADVISDREAAYESADNWRQLYAKEAQQRRMEMRIAQQQIETLKAEIQQIRGESPLLKADNPEADSELEQELAQLQTVEDLKAKLKEVMVEHDRLVEALKTEQANHDQTRKSLTSVIGDTINQLTKERGNHQLSPETNAIKN
jgi:chromosome segregation ATPase